MDQSNMQPVVSTIPDFLERFGTDRVNSFITHDGGSLSDTSLEPDNNTFEEGHKKQDIIYLTDTKGDLIALVVPQVVDIPSLFERLPHEDQDPALQTGISTISFSLAELIVNRDMRNQGIATALIEYWLNSYIPSVVQGIRGNTQSYITPYERELYKDMDDTQIAQILQRAVINPLVFLESTHHPLFKKMQSLAEASQHYLGWDQMEELQQAAVKALSIPSIVGDLSAKEEEALLFLQEREQGDTPNTSLDRRWYLEFPFSTELYASVANMIQNVSLVYTQDESGEQRIDFELPSQQALQPIQQQCEALVASRDIEVNKHEEIVYQQLVVGNFKL